MASPSLQRPDPECEDYYEVLGVDQDASEAEIRKAYYNIARTLHPDRRRPGSDAGSSKALERFHKVQTAWRCLSDPTRRLLYDVRLGKQGDSAEMQKDMESKLIELQKQQAARDLSNMEQALERVLRRETASRGIIVRSALYGDLRLKEECLQKCLAPGTTIIPADLVGPFLDVTSPVQCLVEQHTILLPGGASASKADLPGFYNPLPFDPEAELSLYVLYEFKGMAHEVLVGDREALSMPWRRHAVPHGQAPRGPFCGSNVCPRRPVAETPRGKATRGAEGPSGGVPKSVSVSPVISGINSVKALNKAIEAYRYEAVANRSEDEATPKEFLLFSATLAILGAVFWFKR